MNKERLTQWFNMHHLYDARNLGNNNPTDRSLIVSYLIHFKVAITEAVTQLILCVGSVIHAIFPPLINFKLLDAVIDQTIRLYKFLPKHPSWDRLKRELNNE